MSQTAPTTTTSEDGLAQLGKRLAAGFSVLTTGLAAFGISNGDLSRIMRNDGSQTIMAVVLVLVGIASGLVVAYSATGTGASVRDEDEPAGSGLWSRTKAWFERHASLRGTILVGGFVAFFGGSVWLLMLGVENTSAKDRPLVSATVVTDEAGRMTVSGTVEASGLRRDEHVFVVVDGVHHRNLLSDVHAGRSSGTGTPTTLGEGTTQTLYISSIGPNRDGEVALDVEVPVSPGLYDRIQVSAYLERAKPDAAASLASLDRSLDVETARRHQYEAELGLHELSDEELLGPEEVARRAEYDFMDDGVVSVEERERRRQHERAQIDALLGDEEIEKRADFDDAHAQETGRLLTELQTERVADVRCNPDVGLRGCVSVLLTEAPNRPTLVVSPDRSDDGLTIDIHVGTTGGSADDAIVVRAFGKPVDGAQYDVPFLVVSLPPGTNGSVQEDLTVLVPEGVGTVCAVAHLVRDARGDPRGPPAPDSTCGSDSYAEAAVEMELPEDATTAGNAR